MARAFWISFRIDADAESSTPADHRAKKLDEQIRRATSRGGRCWQGQSFYLFSSLYNLDDLARRAGASIDVAVDFVIIMIAGSRSGRLVGKSIDPKLFELIPSLRTV